MHRANAQLCALILLLIMDIGDSLHLPATFYDKSGRDVSDEDESDTTKRRPELAMTLQSKGLEYILKRSLESIRHDLIQQTPLSLSTSYLDLSITLNDLRFAEFELPELHIHTVSPSRLSLKTSGGFVRLQGAYSAVYKTRRLGQFEAAFEDINAEIFVNVQNEREALKVTSSKCKFEVDQLYVNLTPKLPQQINDAVKSALINAYEQRACTGIERYISTLADKLKNVGLISDFSSKDLNNNNNNENSLEIVQHDLIHTAISEESIHMHWEHKTNRVPLGIVPKRSLGREYTLVEPTMLTVSISDDYLNDRLNSLINAEEVKLLLHKNRRIADLLSLKCDDNEGLICMGQFVKLTNAIDGTGHMTARIIAPPKLHQDAMGMHIYLPLQASISYYTTTHKRIRYATFDMHLGIRIKKLAIDRDSNGKYVYRARLQIESFEVKNAKSSTKGVQKLMDNLETIMKKHQDAVEEVLVSQLFSGYLPLNIDPSIELTDIATDMDENRLFVFANLAIERDFFPQLSVN